MKKQISVLLTVMIAGFLFSCQKEAISPVTNTTTDMQKANHESKMVEGGVPFKGSFATSLVLLQPPPNLVQRVSGTGIASHMGESTFEAISNVTVMFPPPFAVSGTRVITAANGDKLYTRFTGTSTPVVDGKNGADLYETITGGTGRFANATGSFKSIARNDLSIPSFRVDFDGHIKY